jgi:hypothetical protein
MIRLALLGLLSLWPAHAQGVGTASRTVSLAPEEIVVEIVLTTPVDTLVDQAVASLAPLRVTSADLKSVGTLQDGTDRLGWQFTIVRPFTALNDQVKQLDHARRQLRGSSMSYQFFLRPSPKTADAMKRRVLGELVAEAKRNSGGNGKIRSVTIDPMPELIDAGRSSLLFGQPSGLLQFQFSVIVVVDNE